MNEILEDKELSWIYQKENLHLWILYFKRNKSRVDHVQKMKTKMVKELETKLDKELGSLHGENSVGISVFV